MIYDWQTLTVPTLSTIAKRDPVAVLVLGAIEQHGTHLPLGTDLIIGEGLAAAMREHLDPALDVIFLPTIAVGASDEHTSFPGTLSLPAPLAISTLEAYGESIARAGIKRLVLINSHGGNKAIMDLAALTLRQRLDMRVVKATYTRLPVLEGVIAADELRYGLHGGLLETAMMQYLAPATVNLEGYQSAPLGTLPDNQLVGPEGSATFAWLAEDLSQHGVAGDARQATPALGMRLVQHYATQLATVVAETARLPALS
ncbi:creatininase family protein [Vreelandella populi]|uniref:Creatininase family protein n=1 Tax=Vreelandella populi TaxID=2498858 RepID=A0A433LC51_9GAMM|nr:creatininase family protein [Halomonas populi]RUR46282.1 creatininase family protein [Halomonas populi]RUR53220.1 creatininase family protein [Halomonas populi]